MGEFKVDIQVSENGKKSPNWSLDADLDGVYTIEDLLAFTKKSVIAIFGEVLDEEQAAGFPKNPVIVVDGKHNKSPFDVNPLGRIEAISPVNLEEIILPMYQLLLELSPVGKTGQYKNSHLVFFNLERVASNQEELISWMKTNPNVKDGDKIRFVDIQPYAGRLERYGITRDASGNRNNKNTKVSNSKDRKTKQITQVRKPNGVYKQTEQIMKRKFGKNSLIQFEFVPGSQFNLPRYPNSKHEYVYPTILVYVFTSGLT